MPPPPPPPCPPPPMPSLGPPAKGGGGDGRGMLLQSIRQGTALKKTQTNDRSAPTVGGNKKSPPGGGGMGGFVPNQVGNSGGGGGRFPGGGGASGGGGGGTLRGTGGGRTFNNSAGSGAVNGGGGGPPMGLGGLFADGIPRLRPTGQSPGAGKVLSQSKSEHSGGGIRPKQPANHNNNISHPVVPSASANSSSLHKQHAGELTRQTSASAKRSVFPSDMKNRAPQPHPPGPPPVPASSLKPVIPAVTGLQQHNQHQRQQSPTAIANAHNRAAFFGSMDATDSSTTREPPKPPLPSKPPVGGYGKPNLAPKPPGQLPLGSPPGGGSGTKPPPPPKSPGVRSPVGNGSAMRSMFPPPSAAAGLAAALTAPNVNRAHSMRMPRPAPQPQASDYSHRTMGRSKDTNCVGAPPACQQSVGLRNNLSTSALSLNSTGSGGPQRSAPAPPHGGRPSVRPPPPPNRVVVPPSQPPPPPPSAPPPPPHRMGGGGTSSFLHGGGGGGGGSPAVVNQPRIQHQDVPDHLSACGAPPPPVRNSSMRNGPSSLSLSSMTSSAASNGDSLESRLSQRFKALPELPRPERFQCKEKSYPSRTANKRQPAPPPPGGSSSSVSSSGMLQLSQNKMFASDASAC